MLALALVLLLLLLLLVMLVRRAVAVAVGVFASELLRRGVGEDEEEEEVEVVGTGATRTRDTDGRLGGDAGAGVGAVVCAEAAAVEDTCREVGVVEDERRWPCACAGCATCSAATDATACVAACCCMAICSSAADAVADAACRFMVSARRCAANAACCCCSCCCCCASSTSSRRNSSSSLNASATAADRSDVSVSVSVLLSKPVRAVGDVMSSCCNMSVTRLAVAAVCVSLLVLLCVTADVAGVAAAGMLLSVVIMCEISSSKPLTLSRSMRSPMPSPERAVLRPDMEDVSAVCVCPCPCVGVCISLWQCSVCLYV